MNLKELPRLHQLYVYTTDLCNCSCKHCWIISHQDNHKLEPGHFIPVEIFEAAALEAAPLGLTAVKWTGGEPTIHPEFSTLLKLQKKLGLTGRVETNAMEIDRPLAKLLAESGINHIAVSLDGASAGTHEGIRGTAGSYNRTIAGIKNLIEAGFRPQIIMSLMNENILELLALLSLAAQLGAGSVKLNLVQPILGGLRLHSSNETPGVGEILKINQRLNAEFRSKYPFRITLDMPMAFRPIKSILNGESRAVCSIETIIGLLHNGSYALCGIGENVPELVFGRAGRDELCKIWRENQILNFIRNDLPKNFKGICGRCLMKAVCMGSCLAQNYFRSRDLSAPFWFCEEAEKAGLFPESRLSLPLPELTLN